MFVTHCFTYHWCLEEVLTSPAHSLLVLVCSRDTELTTFEQIINHTWPADTTLDVDSKDPKALLICGIIFSP